MGYASKAVDISAFLFNFYHSCSVVCASMLSLEPSLVRASSRSVMTFMNIDGMAVSGVPTENNNQLPITYLVELPLRVHRG